MRQSHAFLEHTQQTLTGNDPDAAFSGSELDRIPSYTAVRSRTALLVRFDLDPRPGRVTWGYEYYSYKRDGFERRNTFAEHEAGPRGRGADGEARRLRRLPGGRRPAGVGRRAAPYGSSAGWH